MNATDGITFEIGDPVEIVSRSYASMRAYAHVCNGYVKRLTATQVIVENEHGNERRFDLRRTNQDGMPYAVGSAGMHFYAVHMLRQAQ